MSQPVDPRSYRASGRRGSDEVFDFDPADGASADVFDFSSAPDADVFDFGAPSPPPSRPPAPVLPARVEPPVAPPIPSHSWDAPAPAARPATPAATQSAAPVALTAPPPAPPSMPVPEAPIREVSAPPSPLAEPTGPAPSAQDRLRALPIRDTLAGLGQQARTALRQLHRPHLTRVDAALVGILLVAAAFRFFGLDWDSGQHLHPDERFITSVASSIKFPSPDRYFDSARSPLNPNGSPTTSYVYGTLPLFVARALGDAIQGTATAILPDGADGLFHRLRVMGQYDGIYLLGRALSGICDLLTILLIFIIARRLYSGPVALVAAALAAFTVLQIQASHFFTVETSLTLFVTLAFYFAVRAAQTGRLLDWSMLGLATGLGAASKLTALMLVVVMVGAAGLLWYRATVLGAYPERRRFVWEDMATGLFVAVALAFAAFRVTQPYAFAGPGIFDIGPNQRFMEVFTGFQRIGTGESDVPFNDSWAGTWPFLWQLTQMALWGMGIPLTIAGWLGVAFAAYQLVRNPRQHHMHLLGLLWVVANFLYWGPQFTKLMRYVLPIYPQLTIFAALVVVAAWQWASARARRPLPTVDGLTPVDSSVLAMDGAAVDGPAMTPPPPRRSALDGLGWLLPWTARAAAVVVVGWTVLYALAFETIYTRPHSRVAASEWIYQNIPAGARVGAEHWDDRLPLGLPGHDLSIYRAVDFPLYNDETAEKRSLLLTNLGQTDYLVLSSNRLYGSIPKLQPRYPMTTRYYQALFSGELGFERIAEFTSRPSLFGLELNDDNAEESFTVYDHPKVTILKKSASYSPEQARAILESVSLDNVMRGLRPAQVGTRGLLLDPADAAADRAGGTWTDTFNRGSFANAAPLLVWYLALQLLAVLALPLTWFICRRLADGGYALAKIVALVTISYLPWLLASLHLLPYTRLSIALAGVALGATAVLVLRSRGAELQAWLAGQRRMIIAVESIFGLVFLGFTAMRAANPDLWHSAYGGEKPMDFAYLNAIIKTTWFPPYDPWLAGGYINYYYFGGVIIGSLIKLTGVVPWVAYNLAIPTIAALTFIAVVSLVYNIVLPGPAVGVRRQNWALGGGVAGAMLAVVCGNLHGIVQIVDWLQRLDRSPLVFPLPFVGGLVATLRGLATWLMSGGQGLPPFNFNFWDPTRVIVTEQPAPITEFPYFTFLYGDLHAHMIAMPIGLLALGLALNLVRWAQVTRFGSGRSLGRDALQFAVSPPGLGLGLAALVLAILRMANTWDFPTYLGIIVGAVVLAEAVRPVAAGEPSASARRDWGAVAGRAAALAAGVLVVSQLAVTPYLASFVQFYTGIEPWKDKTLLPHYLIIMGAFLGIVGLYLGFQFSALRQRLALAALASLGSLTGGTASQGITADVEAPRRIDAPMAAIPNLDRLAATILAAAGFLGVLLVLAGSPVVGVVLVGICALAVVAVLRRPDPAMLFTLLLAATALAITCGVEMVTLKGDLGRMNTVFKFYLQAWFFLSIASGVFLTLMARRAWSSRWLLKGPRRLLAGGVAVLIAITLLYPLLGTPSKLQHRFTPLPASLDGMEYMSVARYEDDVRGRRVDLSLPDDFKAINWMLDHIPGSPVIVEGIAPLYHWRSRVSIYTGLPTVLGWDWHQKQQRGDFGFMVDDRERDVAQIFSSTTSEDVLPLLNRYGVDYIYVGGQERAYYPGAGIEKFDRMVGSSLERVYQEGVVTIYRVVR